MKTVAEVGVEQLGIVVVVVMVVVVVLVVVAGDSGRHFLICLDVFQQYHFH